MRFFVVVLAALAMAGCQKTSIETKSAPKEEAKAAADYPPGDPNNPPETILIQSPYGNVNFTHKKHYDRVNGDCSTCHPKVFPQSRAPLNYKKALHRASEASRNSCAYCHAIGGSSFAADSNCTKCHVREYPKP